MPGGMDSTGLAVGLKKGFIVEKRKLPVKPSSRKGVCALAPLSVPGPRAKKALSQQALRRACAAGAHKGCVIEQLAGSETI